MHYPHMYHVLVNSIKIIVVIVETCSISIWNSFIVHTVALHTRIIYSIKLLILKKSLIIIHK